MSICFQKGDRVVCIEPPHGENWLSGNHGTICRNPVKGSLMAAVCWDSLIHDMSNGINMGHNCGGTCAIGYGWLIPASCLAYENEFEDEEDITSGNQNLEDVL